MSSKTPMPNIKLDAGLNQSMQLTQRLIMSAHMQQAIRVLQIPLQELQTFIEEQVVENPLLEIMNEEGEDKIEEEKDTSTPEKIEEEVYINDRDLAILNRLDEDMREYLDESEFLPLKQTAEQKQYHTFLEQSILFNPNLREVLLTQAHESLDTKRDFEIAEILIGYIDESGFLKTPHNEIASLHRILPEEIERILSVIQSFEPYGIGAASIQECLLIQLRCLGKKSSLAYQIIRDHYTELLNNHIPVLQKKMNVSLKAIQESIDNDIAKLDLHPGVVCSCEPIQNIVPDVKLKLENDQLIVEVDRDYAPSLKLNRYYLKMLRNPVTSAETKKFIKRHLFSARWLMRNLQQRYSTLERIAQSLADKQATFFTQPNGKLNPLTMKMVADELNLHESTIARTVSNKYIYSPRGLFPLRIFFTNKYISDEGEDLSSSTVKDAIRELIEKEDKQHPLSDQKISFLLKNKGIPCARRTIAKYRAVLGVGNTQQRKKFL